MGPVLASKRVLNKIELDTGGIIHGIKYTGRRKETIYEFWVNRFAAKKQSTMESSTLQTT